MNLPKVNEEDYINFVIATPRRLTATGAECVQPESKDAPAPRGLHEVLIRLEADAATLWQESITQIILESGILIFDDSTFDKPYSQRNDLVYPHYSGKHGSVVSGINLITLLRTAGNRAVPTDYRFFDKDTDRKTKNDHFSGMMMRAHRRGFSPRMICFDSWY